MKHSLHGCIITHNCTVLCPTGYHTQKQELHEPGWEQVRLPARRGGPRLLLGGVAADVQEVGGRAAVQLDDVHGRHGQARAVDHAADAAVQADVVQVVLPGRHLPASTRATFGFTFRASCSSASQAIKLLHGPWVSVLLREHLRCRSAGPCGPCTERGFMQ